MIPMIFHCGLVFKKLFVTSSLLFGIKFLVQMVDIRILPSLYVGVWLRNWSDEIKLTFFATTTTSSTVDQKLRWFEGQWQLQVCEKSILGCGSRFCE